MAIVWFCVAAAVLVGYVLLDGFDLGAGIVQVFVARDERDTDRVLSSIGPVWDGNEVWLLAAGGTLLMAFPALFAAAFSGFYLALMIVLWLIMLRGISIEFRSHLDHPLWRPLWGTTFGLSSATVALVLGVALGNVVRGVPLDQSGYFFLPLWTSLSPSGQVGIIDWYTLLVGAGSFLALAVHGSLWVVLKTGGALQARTRLFGAKCWVGSVALTLMITVTSFLIQPNLLKEFRRYPWGLLFPASAVAGMICTRYFSSRQRDLGAFRASCFYLTGMLTSAAFSVFPNVLPSNISPDFSLTVDNAAAAQHGLIVATWWFIPGMALAIAYSVLVYRHFAGKVE